MIFHCENCNLDFEIQNPAKKEYTDPVFGPCSKYIAFCPQCHAECSEKPKRKPARKTSQNAPLFSQGRCGCGSGFCG